jgi:hypothetical protein
MPVRGSEYVHARRIGIADADRKSCEERSKKTGEDCSGVWFRSYTEVEKLDHDTPAILKPGIPEALFPVLAGRLIAYGIIWVAEGFKKDRRSGA